MGDVINFINKSTNTIYSLSYPKSLLGFCEYNFSYFEEQFLELCKKYVSTGSYNPTEAAQLRKSLAGCHIYYEHNLDIIFDKLVIDFYIHYLSRKDNIPVNKLWNRFIPCRTGFEKAVFNRLSDFRYNRAINQWTNLLRVQEYAKNKLDFVFNTHSDDFNDYITKRNYFDLLMNVSTREMGCEMDNVSVIKVYSPGNMPNAPFIMNAVAKSMVKNILPEDLQTTNDLTLSKNESLTDKLAMDAFSSVKKYIPQRIDSFNVQRAIGSFPGTVYLPCGFKSVIDLEFDMIMNDKIRLRKCIRCERYYVGDDEYMGEYCNRFAPGGKSCREIALESAPQPQNKSSEKIGDAYQDNSEKTPEQIVLMNGIESRCAEIFDLVRSNVGIAIGAHEFYEWNKYLTSLKNNVINNNTSPDELDAFLNYSKILYTELKNNPDMVKISMQSTAKPETHAKNDREEIIGGKVVKSFIPEKITRSQMNNYAAEEFKSKTPIVTVQEEIKPPLTHVIKVANNVKPVNTIKARKPIETQNSNKNETLETKSIVNKQTENNKSNKIKLPEFAESVDMAEKQLPEQSINQPLKEQPEPSKAQPEKQPEPSLAQPEKQPEPSLAQPKKQPEPSLAQPEKQKPKKKIPAAALSAYKTPVLNEDISSSYNDLNDTVNTDNANNVPEIKLPDFKDLRANKSKKKTNSNVTDHLYNMLMKDTSPSPLLDVKSDNKKTGRKKPPRRK